MGKALMRKKVRFVRRRNIMIFCSVQIHINLSMRSNKVQQLPSHSYLSAKRHSINHDKLPQPYKIDWGASSFQKSENKSSGSKNFFQNMKDELSNIKNDFEKLIKKQTNYSSASKPAKQESHCQIGGNSGSGMKGKSLSFYKKDCPRQLQQRLEETDKLNILEGLQGKEDVIRPKLLNSQKWEFFQSKRKGKQDDQLISKEQEVPVMTKKIDEGLKESEDSIVQSNQKFRPKEQLGRAYAEQIKKIEQQARQLRLRLEQLSVQRTVWVNEKQKQAKQIQFYKNEFQSAKNVQCKLKERLKSKDCQIQQQRIRIVELAEQLKSKQSEIDRFRQTGEQIQRQRVFYEERMKELLGHNQTFHQINLQLGNENEHLKGNLSNLQSYVQHLKSISNNAENDLKRKLEFMKKEAQQYQKRQNMFVKEIQTLSAQISQQSQPQLSSASEDYELLEQNQQFQTKIEEMKEQIGRLKSEVLLQKQINVGLTSKYENQLKRNNGKAVSTSFQQSLNELIEENAALKSKVNGLTADLASMKEQNRSYLREISMYEEREEEAARNRAMSSTEWQQLTEQIQRLAEENEMLKEKLQFQQLKEEVSQSSLVSTRAQSENILQLASSQLQQIQKMKERTISLQSQNQFLRQQLEVQGQTSFALKQRNKELLGQLKISDKQHCCHMYELEILDRKNDQIKGLKQLIFKVLVAKAGKNDQEDDIDYYLKKIRQFARIWTPIEE